MCVCVCVCACVRAHCGALKCSMVRRVVRHFGSCCSADLPVYIVVRADKHFYILVRHDRGLNSSIAEPFGSKILDFDDVLI